MSRNMIWVLNIGEQPRFRQACAFAQPCQNRHYLHTQRMDMDDASGQTFNLFQGWVCQHMALKEAFAHMR